MVRVENISFAYNGIPIFENLSIELPKGEILCLFGPNGCGKTTFIDNILGHLKPDSGRILIDGKDQVAYSRREFAQKVAYVPQVHEKTFPYSVLDVVVMGRTPYCHGTSSPGKKDYQIAEHALEQTGITHLRKRIYTRLSGGETQLVILARALAQGSPVIIMDEPASHLDFRHELMLLETAAELVISRGISLIMSTHSPNHAYYFENRNLPVKVAIMNKKKFIATGRPRDVLTEKKMCDLFGIKSRLVTENSEQYIIPIQTIKKGTK